MCLAYEKRVCAIDLEALRQLSLEEFCLVDVRGKQSFLSSRLKGSHHISSIPLLLGLESSSLNLSSLAGTHCPPPPSLVSLPNKPFLFLCFSKERARKVAKDLVLDSNFCRVYPFDSVYYLDCGVMEAFEIFDICEGVDTNTESNLPKNSTLPLSSASILIEATIQDIKHKFLNSRNSQGGKAWVVTFSGGKDSTCVLQLVYEMLFHLPKYQRRPTFAIASNTLVEAPHIDRFLTKVIESINTHAKANEVPFEVIQVKPDLKNDFWVNLIGKGYPSPTRTFRWCTDRLKIIPAKAEIAKITRRFGSCILLLGSRKQESNSRKRSIEKRVLNEEGYSQHRDFPDTLTYSPIANWDTDSVWAYLLSHKPLWGKDHSELFDLYAKASGHECQFITDLKQSSCGGSRFGCWVCTVVSEDKSMQGFINVGEKNLKPLNDFRDFIKNLRENPSVRADYKRDGRSVYKVGRLGPFLSKTRIEILRRLLEAESDFRLNGGNELISDEQIMAIQQEWNRDFDFSNSALVLAQKFNRFKECEMPKSKVLYVELLKEDQNDHFSADELEAFIHKSVEIYKTVGRKGRVNAGTKIKDEIEKLLNDKTSKVGGYNVY